MMRAAGIILCALMLRVPFCIAVDHADRATVGSPWVATWGAAMMAGDQDRAADITGKTLREIVHVSLGGEQTRIWLSNRFGREPLHIGAVHVALSGNGSAIQTGSDRAITFKGMASVTIPPGATIVSDTIALNVPGLSNLAVSLYLPERTRASTLHGLASQFSYATTGDQVGATTLGDAAWQVESWYFLTGVDVSAPGDSAVVAIGDSITDGSRSKFNTNHRWPDFLAERLAADDGAASAGVLGVVNVGISGNRVLSNGTGPGSVSRVNEDVLARSGARYLIVLESINDIARYADMHQPYGDLEQRLEWGLAQIAEQAHQHGMKVFGATLTPYKGCPCWTPEGRAVREALNQWIRTTRTFDGVIDFDRAVRDPEHPEQYLPQYDSDDHVHPSEAGYRAMAGAIDLKLFRPKR